MIESSPCSDHILQKCSRMLFYKTVVSFASLPGTKGIFLRMCSVNKNYHAEENLGKPEDLNESTTLTMATPLPIGLSPPMGAAMWQSKRTAQREGAEPHNFMRAATDEKSLDFRVFEDSRSSYFVQHKHKADPKNLDIMIWKCLK